MYRRIFCILMVAALTAWGLDARLGKASQTLQADGQVAPQEYSSGLELWGMISESTGEVTKRAATVFVARDDAGLAVAVVSATHARIAVDERDMIEVRVAPPGGATVVATIDGEGKLVAPDG